jgi:DNA-binding NarL/FixJ family response regulator
MSDRVYRLLLIDRDRIFRIGMLAYLAQIPDLDVVAEIDDCQAVAAFLSGEFAADLVILDLALDLPCVDVAISDRILEDGRLTGINLCRQIKINYPQLPIFLLSAPTLPQLVADALQLGIEGYCLKGTAADILVAAIRQVAAGKRYLGDRAFYPSASSNLPAINNPSATNIIAIIKRNFYQSGLRHIDQVLSEVETNLANMSGAILNNQGETEQDSNQNFSQNLQQIILAGQARELRAAKWLMAQIWRPEIPSENTDQGVAESSQSPQFNGQFDEQFNDQTSSDRPDLNPATDITKPNTNALAVQASLWDRTVNKLQSSVTNLSKVPLEIDILKDDKKRELLYMILRQTEQVITELRLSQVPIAQIEANISAILRDIWRSAVIDFFGKYLVVYRQEKTRAAQEINVVEVLLKDEAIAQSEFLNKIPQFLDLISHLLYATDLNIDNALAAMGTVEAMRRSELILDHLLIQVANAVVQPLLNHFADVEKIKQQFYRYNLLGTREVERFRNDLSWKYRVARYVSDPQLIFESRYSLFTFTDSGIKQVNIYAPRNQELQTLEGVQLAVTLALELQDAIAPRLKSAITLIGNGFVYILTNVIGRGIGLIGRGVVQGIGNAWQDRRKT